MERQPSVFPGSPCIPSALASLIIEPHNAIVGEAKRKKVLNMTAKTSEAARKASVDIAKEPTAKVIRFFKAMRQLHQKSLQN